MSIYDLTHVPCGYSADIPKPDAFDGLPTHEDSGELQQVPVTVRNEALGLTMLADELGVELNLGILLETRLTEEESAGLNLRESSATLQR